MILGVANGESYIGSDVPAILKYTRDVYYIGNQEMARVRKVRLHSITWMEKRLKKN